MRFKAVLFDLDGTLVDTIPDIIQATNAMRVQLGLITLDDATITAYVGRGTEELVLRALAHDASSPPSKDLFYQGLTLFKQCYHEVNGQQSVLFDGVLDGLQAFARAGVGMAVVTNKQTAFTVPLLQQTGLADYFDAVVCGDTCAEKKPHPMPLLHACQLLGVVPEQALMVGDSVNDALAARAAGMAVVILPYGYNEGQDVRNLEVDDIVPSIAAAALWAASHS
ncbi:MAG: phosphoglycolate phosphatase [Burkholderiaceae bacterium]|nr:phosphoglycolate phosphatase [Burkholderiaceae bacterium]